MIGQDKTRLSITLSQVQYEKVKAAAAELGISISSYLSIAAMEKIQRDSRKKQDRS